MKYHNAHGRRKAKDLLLLDPGSRSLDDISPAFSCAVPSETRAREGQTIR